MQYFLFFGKSAAGTMAYTTFPNTNLCLALYRDSRVLYERDGRNNHCTVFGGGGRCTSRLYGFHEMPFKVSVDGKLDQVCILFRPGGLRAFTALPYDELMADDDVYVRIFGHGEREALFNLEDGERRARHLEDLLLRQLRPERCKAEVVHLLTAAIGHLDPGSLTVGSMAAAIGANVSTVYRGFQAQLGQSPKEFLRTVRFRRVLDDLMRGGATLTDVAHTNHYYDQAHFNVDLKRFSGCTPRQLADRLSLTGNELAWFEPRQMDDGTAP